MLRNFGFDFALEPTGRHATSVTSMIYYDLRGLLGAIVNVLMTRRKFRQIRARMLANLAALSEKEGAGKRGERTPNSVSHAE